MGSTSCHLNNGSLVVIIPREQLELVHYHTTETFRLILETDTSRLRIQILNPPLPPENRIANLNSRPPPSTI